MSRARLAKLTQKGAIPLPILIAGLVLIGFLAISYIAPFGDNLLSSLFPKNASQAAAGCQALTVQKNQNINNFTSDLYTWSDSNCKSRSAAMASNTVQDPFGHWGGVLNRYTYDLGSSMRTVKSNNGTHPGFGEVVDHFGDSAYVSNWDKGVSFKTAFQGAYHAIHEYKFRLNLGAPVDATVEWFFASGRDHPVYAITYDCRSAPTDSFWADYRSPYSDMEFDGAVGSNVDGIGWGDHFKFRTLTSPVNTNTGWEYTQPNTVPYVAMWINGNDAEQGLVQTQTWQQHDAGGFWLYSEWGTTHTNGPMPQDWNWPYQLNQYELPFTTASKRMAWGSNYGGVCRTSYSALGDSRTLSSYPFQSYSVYLVLDKHSKNPVASQVTEIENIQKSTLTASTGTVITQGPAGIARTDNTTYQPAGYNQIFGTWEIQANANKATFTLNPGGTTLKNPIFVIRNYTLSTIPQTLLVNGQVKQKDIDFLPSLDTSTQTLWLTLNSNITSASTIDISSTTPSPSTSSPSPSASASPIPSIIPSPKPGDVDGNNKVDIFDYNLLLTNFGKTGSGIAGDLDGNNKVDIFDYNILLTNFGK